MVSGPQTPRLARPASVPVAGAAPPAAGDSLPRQRCEQFVAALVQELQNDSDPAAVADVVYDQVGFLPVPVRSHLQRGDWQRAWSSLQDYLPGETWQGLDAMLRASPESAAWLGKVAANLLPEDDDAENAA